MPASISSRGLGNCATVAFGSQRHRCVRGIATQYHGTSHRTPGTAITHKRRATHTYRITIATIVEIIIHKWTETPPQFFHDRDSISGDPSGIRVSQI